MIFDGFKSPQTLGREIRDWYYNDNVILLGNEEAHEMRDMAYERSIIEVSKDVIENAYSNYMQNKAMGGLTGDRGSTGENMRYLKGVQLVQKLAKKKGWRLIQEGSPAFGYSFEIIEMPD